MHIKRYLKNFWCPFFFNLSSCYIYYINLLKIEKIRMESRVFIPEHKNVDCDPLAGIGVAGGALKKLIKKVILISSLVCQF